MGFFCLPRWLSCFLPRLSAVRFAFSLPSVRLPLPARLSVVCTVEWTLSLFLSFFLSFTLSFFLSLFQSLKRTKKCGAAASGGGQWSGVGGLPLSRHRTAHLMDTRDRAPRAGEAGRRGRNNAAMLNFKQCSSCPSVRPSVPPSVRQRECRNYPSSLTSSPTQSVSQSVGPLPTKTHRLSPEHVLRNKHLSATVSHSPTPATHVSSA